MKKYLWVYILAIMVVQSVYAANYNYTTITSLPQNVNSGESFDATILINPSTYNETTYYLTKTNETYNQLNITWHDQLIINNSGGRVIHFLEPNTYKSEGEIFTPPKGLVGIINFVEVNFSNQTISEGSLIINPPPEANILRTFLSDNSEIVIIFTPNTTYLNDTTIITLSAAIPKNYNPGATSINYKILGDDGSIMSNNLTVNVRETKKWNTTVFNQSIYNVSIGDSGEFAKFTLDNIGNVVTDVNYLVTGNISEILTPPLKSTIYPSQSVQGILLYQTGLLQKTGQYVGTVVFFNDLDRVSFNVSVNLNDKSPPKISSVTANNTMATVQTSIRILATDNTQLNETTWMCSLGDEILNGTTAPISNVYDIFLTPQGIGDYNCSFQAYDVERNMIETTGTFNSAELESVIYKDTVILGKMKYDVYDERPLFTVKYPVTFSISLLDFSIPGKNITNNTNDFTIRIGNGEEERFLSDINESVEFINTTGNFTFAIINDEADFINGILSITTPDYHIATGNLQFSGELVTYVIPKPFCINVPWGGAVCGEPVENNNGSYNYEIQKYTIPGDANIDDVGILISPREINDYKNQSQIILAEEVHEKNMMIGVVVIMILLLILGVAAYLAKIYVFDVRYFPKHVRKKDKSRLTT